MTYKAILLDLDHTLYDYESANAVAKQAALKHIGDRYAIAQDKVALAFKRAREMVHARLHGTGSSHNRLLYCQKALEILNVKGYQTLTETHDLFWQVFFSNMQAADGVVEFLRNKTFPVCIVTDFTAEIQFRKLRQLGILEYVEFVVTSEEAGIEKPAPEIFRLALEKLGLQAGEVCMVGDDWEKDVQGAMRCGITPFWFNHLKLPAKDKAIVSFTSFSELSELLNG